MVSLHSNLINERYQDYLVALTRVCHEKNNTLTEHLLDIFKEQMKQGWWANSILSALITFFVT